MNALPRKPELPGNLGLRLAGRVHGDDLLATTGGGSEESGVVHGRIVVPLLRPCQGLCEKDLTTVNRRRKVRHMPAPHAGPGDGDAHRDQIQIHG